MRNSLGIGRSVWKKYVACGIGNRRDGMVEKIALTPNLRIVDLVWLPQECYLNRK